MALEIPFVRQMPFAYGEAAQLSPLVRRVVAPNPGLLTLYGTNTYLVGRGEVGLIDPGPLLEEHREALQRALDGEAVTHILVTHSHLDHCESARAWSEATGAVVASARRGRAGAAPRTGGPEEGVDPSFAPDLVLHAGDRVQGPGWALEAVPTPGHTSDHLCFALHPGGSLFTGDHVMGWSTSVIIPPDGDVRAYVASLRLLQGRGDRELLPGHGPAVPDPPPYLAALIAHREEREGEILAALAAGKSHIAAIVSVVYTDVDPRLHPAAGLSVLAHLRSLVAEGRVACGGEPTLEAEYRLA